MALKKFNFNVLKKDKFARLGKIITHRGVIDTPVFMPVGTQATVKGSFIDDVIKTGSQIVLSNSYHLNPSFVFQFEIQVVQLDSLYQSLLS